MGICLDTAEQNHGPPVFEEEQRLSSADEFRYTSTPPDGAFPMHNGGNVQFETPKVPVIFVLGGPGSGKVTHCDNLTQEKRGIVHINMTDLLQQYAIGNDMQDFGQLSSKTVTEVLMLEMKMAPHAKTYLVSGYPRNMRDVVEYSEKIQVVNGVILIQWRQKVLERQIDYGAKLGQVVLSLAKMELESFYKNTMPVADYFDQSGMLISINGERHPGDVYKDFRDAVMRILSMQNNPPELEKGKTAQISNEVEPVVDHSTNVTNRTVAPPATRGLPNATRGLPNATLPRQQSQAESTPDVITVRALETPEGYQSPVKPSGWPPVVWVIGGPGSNKATLCAQVVKNRPSWVHISVGRLLRATAENIDNMADANIIRQSISAGEMVPPNIVMQILETHMKNNISAVGVIIDGYPRDLKQVDEFEQKFKQMPTMVLLDCSKLQLGRGRLDDSVSAFRRRLEVFRELSLPMLKSLDNDGRLIIVDGDTDAPQVQEDFQNVMLQQMEELEHSPTENRPPTAHVDSNHNRPTTADDLKAVTGLETIDDHQRYADTIRNVTAGVANGVIANGYIANGTKNLVNNVQNRLKTTTLPNGSLANGGLANGIVNTVRKPANNQVGDMYTNAMNHRRDDVQVFDMDGINHI